MDFREIFTKAHERVWNLRAEIGDVWKTPTALDCVRYAFTEAAELMDADMRMRNSDHARNHERKPDLVGEACDVAIMLLSALGPDFDFGKMEVKEWIVRFAEHSPVDVIAIGAGKVLKDFYVAMIDGERPHYDVLFATLSVVVSYVEHVLEVDFMDAMDERLARLKDKHGGR